MASTFIPATNQIGMMAERVTAATMFSVFITQVCSACSALSRPIAAIGNNQRDKSAGIFFSDDDRQGFKLLTMEKKRLESASRVIAQRQGKGIGVR